MTDNRRAEYWADVVGDIHFHDAPPDKLIEELDAMVAFLRIWSSEYGEDGESRLAMIAGMVADIATILALHFVWQHERKVLNANSVEENR